MLYEEVTGCFQPLLAVFKFYGLQFCSNDGDRFSGLIFIARCVMMYLTASGSAFIAFLLGYHLVYKMEDIQLVCLWASIQSMIVTSLIFYVTAAIRQAVLKDFFKNLKETLNIFAANEAKLQRNYKFLCRLCCGLMTFGYSVEVVTLLNAALDIANVHHEEPVYENIAYNIVGIHEDPHNFYVFWTISLIYQFLSNTFLHMYGAILPVVCLTLNLCLNNLKEENMTFSEYHSKHKRICQLVGQADELFSPFLFIVVIRDVIIVILVSRMFGSHFVIWHNVYIVWLMLQSIISLCGQMYCAALLNEKVSADEYNFQML